MANEEQLTILKQGVDVWNRWRENNPNEKINLYNADLSEIKLCEANLTGANLRRANLRDADFSRADLTKAILYNGKLQNAVFQKSILYEADLSFAALNHVDFSEANLSKANLSATTLPAANLKEAKLKNTDFSEGMFEGTIFGANDLRTAIGLERAKHFGPSYIDTRTLQISHGKIPEEFLRGCGLSDLDIAYAKLATPSLDAEQVSQIIYEIHQIYLDQPLRFYNSFISYSSKDEVFGKKLYDDLQNNGVRCYFAAENMKIGDRIRPAIDHQIRIKEKVIVIISENSLQSEWVGDEVEAALEQERIGGKDVLVPIRLDDAVLNIRDDWAAKIKRRRNIGNFSKWKDDAEYKKMFKRLLKDLRASEE